MASEILCPHLTCPITRALIEPDWLRNPINGEGPCPRNRSSRSAALAMSAA